MHVRFGLLAVALMGFAAACNGSGTPALPGNSTVSALSGTDAVIGSAGKLYLRLGDPVQNATTVELTSSAPTIAAIAATATVPAGSQDLEISWMGVAPGTSVLTAKVGTS